MGLSPYSSSVLALCALVLIGIGLYFVLLRPALLAEDVRYIGTSSSSRSKGPGMAARAFGKVFWVMGGYIVTAGLLTLYVAIASFRSRAREVSGAVDLLGEAAALFRAERCSRRGATPAFVFLRLRRARED